MCVRPLIGGCAAGIPAANHVILSSYLKTAALQFQKNVCAAKQKTNFERGYNFSKIQKRIFTRRALSSAEKADRYGLDKKDAPLHGCGSVFS